MTCGLCQAPRPDIDKRGRPLAPAAHLRVRRHRVTDDRLELALLELPLGFCTGRKVGRTASSVGRFLYAPTRRSVASGLQREASM